MGMTKAVFDKLEKECAEHFYGLFPFITTLCLCADFMLSSVGSATADHVAVGLAGWFA